MFMLITPEPGSDPVPERVEIVFMEGQHFTTSSPRLTWLPGYHHYYRLFQHISQVCGVGLSLRGRVYIAYEDVATATDSQHR
jgi:hypothetical protein